MIPATLFILLTGIGFLLGLIEIGFQLVNPEAAETMQTLRTILIVYFFTLLAVALWDASRKKHQPKVQLERILPTIIPVGQWTTITIRIRHAFSHPTNLKLFDHYPVSEEMEGLPAAITLQPGKTGSVTYRFKPVNRGEFTFYSAHLLQLSPLSLWQFSSFQGDPSTVRVYPDISRITGYIRLATSNQTSQMGIRLQQRRGEGMEFHQLREYQQGDSPRRIDWKASSRRQKLIAREYQDEKDQQIIFMLDSGRTMRSQDNRLSHFDHALNALLLLSYVALHKGDAVGLLSFGGERDRWLKPVKSLGGINQILSTLYDLQPSTRAPDYLKAVEYLKARYQKRSLIILISNLRDEATADLSPALSLLVKDHLVLFANLRETVLDQTLAKSIRTFDEALSFCGTFEYLKQRNKGQKRIRQKGISALDANPAQLPILLVNRYYLLKRSSQL